MVPTAPSLRFSALALVGLLALGGLAALTPGAAEASTGAGCDRFYLEGVGMVCDRGGGQYELVDADGNGHGLVHEPTDPRPEHKEGSAIYNGHPVHYRGAGREGGGGLFGAYVSVTTCPLGTSGSAVITWSITTRGCVTPPPPPPPPPVATPGNEPRQVHCVDGEPGEYYVKAAYLRSYDDVATVQEGSAQAAVNGFFYTDDEVRDMFRQANEWVDRSGMKNDNHADFKVECAQGDIELHQVLIYTPIDYVDFSAIRGEMVTRHDWNDPKVKYWIYWDDTRGCTCGGLGQRMADHSAAASNANNGNSIPQYAVTFDAGWTTLLHEGGHTLGTVQDTGSGFASPPHASLAAHCYDSRDIMCYDDGGPNGTLFGSARNCSMEEWDCTLDDYFSTAPGTGSYLASNWNTGADYVRYTQLDGSTMTDSICTEDGFVDVPVTCTFRGGNDGARSVDYRIDWGDGTTTSTNGPVGAYTSSTHAYTAPGTYLAHIYATDVGSPWPNESGGHPWLIKVREAPDPVGIGI